jgi:glycosyltransferase involved in cell wall biosynthesis
MNAVRDRDDATISIVIPCFNAASTLRATLESAIAQGDFATEIVAIDDGSIDETVAVARSFEPRVRVLRQPHRGVSAARNLGIAQSLGKWIVFLDSDDQLLPHTLRSRLEAAQDGPDVVVCDWREFDDTRSEQIDRPIRSIDWDALAADAETACATNVWATTAALMYRRNLVEKIGGFRSDLPVIQDARFLFDAAYHDARFARSRHVGARYRVLPESLSRRDPGRFWRDCLLNGQQIEMLWRERNALSPSRRAALAEIFNGAAQGLFRAGDPAFEQAIIALKQADLSLSWRNRFAKIGSDLLGRDAALTMADFCTTSRRAMTRWRKATVRPAMQAMFGAS